MPRASTLLQFLIVFIGGFNFALPSYGWATPIQVVHGVFLNYALLIIYSAALFTTGKARLIRVNGMAFQFAMLIACLSLLGVVSAGINQYATSDFGRALKLLLFSAYFLLVVHWSRSRGSTFFLRAYLIGIAAASAINIYYSVTATDVEKGLGYLPMLISRNGAGGLSALAVPFGAWLMISRRTRGDAAVAITASLIGIGATAISFSKTAMTIGLCGIIAWLFVLTNSLVTRRSRRIGWTCLAVLLLAVIASPQSAQGSDLITLVSRLVQAKFGGLNLGDKYSLGARYMYLWGVSEVLVEHPLVGVSYSGFYDAITRTPSYRTGQMADEDPEAGARGESNPHNSFLFYAATNGLPGLVIVSLLFVVSLHQLFRSLASYGLSGRAIWACLALAYVLYGITLPTLFDTEVLYLPAAVAMAQVAEQRALKSSQFRASHRLASQPTHAITPSLVSHDGHFA
jgi:O-antigen ligase